MGFLHEDFAHCFAHLKHGPTGAVDQHSRSTMRSIDLVNTLQGTESVNSFSHGNTLPITAMPFGMNHWAAQTTTDFRWWFRAGDRKLQGVRCTHQPSPWIADYAPLLLMAATGEERLLNPDAWSSSYRPAESTFRAHRFETTLTRYRTKLAFVPTQRGGAFKIDFPANEPHARLIFRADPGEPGTRQAASIQIDAKTGLVTGRTTVAHHGVPKNFAMYFALKLSMLPMNVGTFATLSPKANDGATTIDDHAAGCYLEWSKPSSPIVAKIATSFISAEQALLNLKNEVEPFTFDELAKKAEEAWAEQFAQIELDGIDDERRATFYTCFYRTKLFPRAFHEIDAAGKTVHFSPFDGTVRSGPFYTDNGFWDTYRTQFPLLCLLDPPRVGEMIEGYLNAYRAGGWLPQWASPGYRACMIGTHSDAVIADAILRGIAGFDVTLAYEAIKKNGTVPSDDPSFGRKGLADLRNLGFLTTEHYHGTCATLDFAYDDFCIGQLAKHLGKTGDAKQFEQYSQTYRNVFDAGTGFFRGKRSDGSWLSPFSPFDWGGPYVEGAAWQHAFDVPHDPAGLIALHGGDAQLVAKLDEMISTPPHFNVGDYHFEIHEMTEMAAVDFGQYAHSNQPVHHTLMMYAAAGRPDRMQHWVRRVMNELYSTTPTGLCGDEDNGEMTAWFVLNAIGLFPLCPGRPEWVLTSPIAQRATIKPVGGKPFTVVAKNASRDAAYVHSITLNGKPHERLVIDHAHLAGSTIEFAMSAQPGPTKAWPASSRPGSVSKYPS
ncbi:MAG: GH92 family glycosyl hydrolase [Tepidisphaeraceae bacterium]